MLLNNARVVIKMALLKIQIWVRDTGVVGLVLLDVSERFSALLYDLLKRR
jgi:hypothetical protein